MHRALIAVVAALVLPASASATTYCVKNLACEQAGGTHADDLQVALMAAAQHAGHDDVSLGAGTYVGNFTSSDPAGVSISGARGQTVLQPGLFGAPDYPFVLTLEGPSRLTGVHIALGSAEAAKGISLAGGATADAIDVDGAAVDQGAVQLDGGTLSDSTAELPADDSIGVRAIGSGGTLACDAIWAESGVSAMAAGGSTTRLHAVRLGGFRNGLSVLGGDVQLTDSVLDLRTQIALLGVYVAPYSGSSNVEAHNITIVGDGSDGQLGISGYSGGGTSVSVHVRDSILADLATPVQRRALTGQATIALDRVDRWPDNAADDTPGNGQLTDADPLAVAPGFTDPSGGDFSLDASSPLVDAGTPGGLDAGEPSTDVTGAPRITDGNGDCTAQRDIGAYERAGAACAAPGSGGVAPAPTPSAADTTAPRITKVRLRRRSRALVVRFRLSELATVKVTAGKRRGAARRLAAGARMVRIARVPRHRLRVSLIATDASGNRARITRRIR
jgi:hypothetical protein